MKGQIHGSSGIINCHFDVRTGNGFVQRRLIKELNAEHKVLRIENSAFTQEQSPFEFDAIDGFIAINCNLSNGVYSSFAAIQCVIDALLGVL